MRRLLSALTLVCGLLGIAVPASAQGVIPSGAFTSGHTVRCQNATCTVVTDSGKALGSNKLGQGYLTELGITNTGTPVCINDALISGAYHQLCFGANVNGEGAIISYNAYAGADELACQFDINGVKTPCGLSISGSAMVINKATLAITATATYPVGVWRQDYASGVGADPLFYLPQVGPCASNTYPGTSITEVNDGGSCVNSSDGNSWRAKFPPSGADWRQFGVIATATDNQTNAQSALNAGMNLGIPVRVCGVGTFKTSVLYFYATPLEWCSHETVLQRIAAGPVLVLADAVGNTYPATVITSTDVRLATIDMNGTLVSSSGGAGIVIQGVNNWYIFDPIIYNIPTNRSTAPNVSGAPVGTFAWTDANGIGWVENGGIVGLGGGPANVEGGTLVGGFVGNYHFPGQAACAGTLGAAGLVFTVPSTAMATSSSNPPNANKVLTGNFDCNFIGIRDDYGSANRYELSDMTFSGGVGLAIGTYGRYDILISGTPSGSSTVGITFMANGLNSDNPLTIQYTGTGTASAIAAALAASINSSSDLQGLHVTAGVWPVTSTSASCASSNPCATIHIDYGDEFSAANTTDPPLNFAFCAANTSPSCTGVMHIEPYHVSNSWDVASSVSCEICTVGAIYIGPQIKTYQVEMPQQVTGAGGTIVHNHSGPAGAAVPIIVSNQAAGAGTGGTTKTADFTADCETDPQPYFISTGSGAVTATMGGTSSAYAKCTFVDDTSGGNWGIKPFTVAAPVGWGVITVMGGASQTFTTSYDTITLTYVPQNNSNTINTGGNNSGGDWLGAGSHTANIFRSNGTATSWTSSATLTTIGTVSSSQNTLSIPLAKATYNCSGHLSVTASGASGGIKVAMVASGGLTATSATFTAQIFNGATLQAQSTVTSLGSTVGNTAVATDVYINGTIFVSTAGTINLEAAQNASDGTTLIVGAGSTLTCNRAN